MHPTVASGADYRAKPALVKAGICPVAMGAAAQILPWQCLNFLPEPQGQGALRPVPAHGERGPAGWAVPRDAAPLPPLKLPPARLCGRGAGVGAGPGKPPIGALASAIAGSRSRTSAYCPPPLDR